MSDPIHIGEALARRALAVGAKRPREHAPTQSGGHLAREFEEHWDRTCPPRFQAARLDGLDPDVGEQLTAWASEARLGNLLLIGPVGSGKSWAAWAVLRYLAERGLRAAGVGASAYVDAGRPGGTADIWRDATALLIDDLGAEHSTGWAADRVFTLVDHRWQHELATIVTSNLEPRALAEAVGPRVWSRLRDEVTVIRVAGRDRRRPR